MASAGSVKVNPLCAKNMPLMRFTATRRVCERLRQIRAGRADKVADSGRRAHQAVVPRFAW
jgi:hypothetical protein